MGKLVAHEPSKEDVEAVDNCRRLGSAVIELPRLHDQIAAACGFREEPLAYHTQQLQLSRVRLKYLLLHYHLPDDIPTSTSRI